MEVQTVGGLDWVIRTLYTTPALVVIELFCPSGLINRNTALRPLPYIQYESGLPHGWEVRHSNSKNLPYYFNPATKESRWEPPTGTDTEKLKVYMAEHHSGPADRYASGGSGGGSVEGKIRASHLLIKHRESRRPSSWRESEITRSKEEALEILRGHERRIRAGEATLGDIAMSESDCSSARKKGDFV
ncbi:peptidyl-prolyl cis-trans isomerase ssp-1, partial [Histoplasma capsulatum]